MTFALQIQGLSKTYANGFQALNKVDLEVQDGDFFALLGHNGAGKTTLIGILTSLVNKSEGQITVCNYDLDTQLNRAKRFIGLVPQEFNCNIFEKPWDILVQQASYYGIPKSRAKEQAEKFLKKLDLWDKRSQPTMVLSGGMKRRLMIARALMHDPKLLILDEPTAGVDVEIRHAMWEYLTELNKKEKKTIILTTHYLEEAERLCKNIAIINNGAIVENTSMRALLRKLNKESFIFELQESLSKEPSIEGADCTLIDDTTLEIAMDKKHDLTTLFKTLSKRKILVKSMRNKSNRLEQYFMSLTKEGSAEEVTS